MSDLLQAWNAMPPDEAAQTVLPCNGSPAWARAMVSARPFADTKSLFAAADDAWRSLPLDDWQQAFDSHPRIGESHAKAAGAQSLAWSEGEQSAASPQEATRTALADGNRAYEARFGRIFLICATGKSAAEMLAILQRRLANDPDTELLEAAEQQRRITQLRLRKWLGLPAAYPDAV